VCECRPASMTFTYTGGSCDDTTHFQSGKLLCEGPAVDGPVDIECDSGDVFTGVQPGSDVTLTSSGGKLSAQTTCMITGSGGAQMLSIHTSCSKLLRTKDQYGAFVVKDWACQGSSPVVDPDTTVCNCRPDCIHVEYTGGSCDATTHDQEGKFLCSGGALNGTISVSTAASVSMADGGVSAGGVFGIGCQGERVDANTDLVLTDGSGATQTMTLHTSCSKRLAVGDVYGALTIADFTCADGGGGGGSSMSYSMGGSMMNYDTDAVDSPSAMVEVRFFRDGVLVGMPETVAVPIGGGVVTCDSQPAELAAGPNASSATPVGGVSNMEMFPFALEDSAVPEITDTRQCVPPADCIIPSLTLRSYLQYVPPNPSGPLPVTGNCGTYTCPGEGDVDLSCTLDPELVGQTIGGVTYKEWTMDCVKCYCDFDPAQCDLDPFNPGSGSLPWCVNGSTFAPDGTPCCDRRCFCDYQFEDVLQCPAGEGVNPAADTIFAMFYSEPTTAQVDELQDRCCVKTGDTCAETLSNFGSSSDLYSYCSALPVTQAVQAINGWTTDYTLESMAETCCTPDFPVSSTSALIGVEADTPLLEFLGMTIYECSPNYAKECCCVAPALGCNYDANRCAANGGDLPACSDIPDGESGSNCCSGQCFCAVHYDSAQGGQYVCDAEYSLKPNAASIPFAPVLNPSPSDLTTATLICCDPDPSQSPSPSPSPSATPSPSASPSVSPSQTPQHQLAINFANRECVTDNCVEQVPWNAYSRSFDVKFERRVYDDDLGQFVIQNIEPENWIYFNLAGIKIYSRIRPDCWNPSSSETLCQDSLDTYEAYSTNPAAVAYFTTSYGEDVQNWPAIGLITSSQNAYPVSYFCSGDNTDTICRQEIFVPTWLSVDDDGSGQPATFSPKVYEGGVYPNDVQATSERGYAGVVDCREVMAGFWAVNTSFTIQKYVVLVEQPISSTGVPGPCEVWVDGVTYCMPEGRVTSAITFGSPATQDIDGNNLNLETNLEGVQTTPRYSSFNCPSVSVNKKEDF